MFIEIQAVPLLEQVEKRDRKAEPHLEIRPNSLPQMFKFANLRKQREDGFDQHSVVPLAAPAKFEVFRLIDLAPKVRVRQNDHLVGYRFDQAKKLLVGNIRRLNLPAGDESEFVCQEAEFTADDPFPRSESFFADSFSFRLMIFTNRVTQLDAVRIDDAEQSRFCQKRFGQLAMRLETAKESCSLGQSRKKRKPVLFDPSVESVLRTAFESKQKSKRDKFTQGKFGLNMGRRLLQHIVYTAIKFYDKVFLSHGIGFLYIWFGHQYSRNFSVTFSTSTNG
jgi:hypothetical protein